MNSESRDGGGRMEDRQGVKPRAPPCAPGPGGSRLFKLPALSLPGPAAVPHSVGAQPPPSLVVPPPGAPMLSLHRGSVLPFPGAPYPL